MNHESPKKPSNAAPIVVLGLLVLGVVIAVVLIANPFGGNSTASNNTKPDQSTTTTTRPANTSTTTTPPNNSSSNANNSSTTKEPSTPVTEQTSTSTSTSTSTDPFKATIDAEARPVLEKAITAQGGLEAVQKLAAMHWTGKTTTKVAGQTIESDVETWIQRPSRVRQTVKLSLLGNVLETTIAIDGNRGWQKAPNQQLQVVIDDLPEQSEQIRNAKQDLAFDPILSLIAVTESAATFTYIGLEEVDGVQAHAIELVKPLVGQGVFYFHPETFLLMKLHREGGGTLVDRMFQNYETVSGFQVARLQITVVKIEGSGEFSSETTISSVEINPVVSDALFAKPQQ